MADENVINREFGNLELISNHFEKLVVSMDDINLGNPQWHPPSIGLGVYRLVFSCPTAISIKLATKTRRH